MENLSTALLVGVVLVVVAKLFTLLHSYLRLCKKLKSIYQPPSHWLKGHMDQLKGSSDYLKAIRTMVKDEGIRMYCVWFGPFPVVGVTHPETVRQVIKQTSEKGHGFADPYRFFEQWLGDGLVMSNGHKWERNRKLLTAAFHFDILKDYIPRMNECADRLLEKLDMDCDNGHSIEIMGALKKATLETILKCSLSYNDEIQNRDDHPYLTSVERASHLLWERILNPLLFSDQIYNLSAAGAKMKETLQNLHDFTAKIIVKRKKEIFKSMTDAPSNRKRPLDFLDILLTVKDETGAGLSDTEIQNEVDTFTFAGHDTTMSTMTWTLHALGKHPELQELVYEEVRCVLGSSKQVQMKDIGKLEYLTCFVKETLRFYTPVALISRAIAKPIVIDGVEIPVGPRIDIPIVAIHHNPEVWPDHMEFRPERFSKDSAESHHPYAFIPFSAGPRNCIGQTFAMNEIKIFIAKLLHRFEVRLDEDHEPVPIPALILTSENGVQIKLKRRQE